MSINAVKMLNGTTGWAVGNTGTIVKTTNGGTTWTTQTSGTGQTLYSTRLVGGAGYVVGGAGTILYASAADLALPVTLRYFGGRMTEVGALLGWQIATETNNARFNIERSRDRNRTGVPADQGLNFESIGSVPSQAPQGNSVQRLTYSFTVAQSLPGVLSRISLGTLPAGVYTLQVQTEAGRQTFRMLL